MTFKLEYRCPNGHTVTMAVDIKPGQKCFAAPSSMWCLECDPVVPMAAFGYPAKTKASPIVMPTLVPPADVRGKN